MLSVHPSCEMRFVCFVGGALQVGEMIKDREAVVYSGMTGKGLKVRLCFRCGVCLCCCRYNISSVYLSNSFLAEFFKLFTWAPHQTAQIAMCGTFSLLKGHSWGGRGRKVSVRTYFGSFLGEQGP